MQLYKYKEKGISRFPAGVSSLKCVCLLYQVQKYIFSPGGKPSMSPYVTIKKPFVYLTYCILN